MNLRFSLLVLFFALSLGACSSKPEHGKGIHKLFTTEIHANGSKRFVVAIVYPQNTRENAKGKSKRSGKKGDGGKKNGNRGKGQGRPQSDDQQNSFSQNSDGGSSEDKREEIIALLEEKIVQTNYCRHGYIELDYSQMRDKTELIGECQESASNEDKQRWD